MISSKAQKIKSFIAMDILEESLILEKEGKTVIPFSLGEPDFNPPECVKEACRRALTDNKTKYTHSQGLLELREAIAEHYHNKYRVTIHPDQIIVTEGTSPAFFLLFSTIMERGDEIILPNPHYPCDANFVQFLDGKPIFVPIHEKEDYQWDVKKVRQKISKKTRGVFVTSPSNPTGTVLHEGVLKDLSNLSVPVVSDEIYHGLVYPDEATLPPAPSPRGRGEGGGGAREHSVLEFTDEAFVVNGFSKAYAMTGFRLGYLIAPKKYIRPLQKIQQNFFISANTFVQYAGIAALKKAGPDLERMRQAFVKRREVMLKGLKRLRFNITYNPQGAFYIFVKIPTELKSPLAPLFQRGGTAFPPLSKGGGGGFGSLSYRLAFDILRKAHVAVTPGCDFGSGGEGHLRFSYAVSVEKIEEGLERLRKYLENR